jgi:hypothetical protein
MVTASSAVTIPRSSCARLGCRSILISLGVADREPVTDPW